MDYRAVYEDWLSNPYFDEATKAELKALEGNEEEIKDRFYTELSFGTAGLRGVMGMGTNMMNVYVIRHATQAFAEVILEEAKEKEKTIAVCYDCRNNSALFAREAALVMAANGIKALLFEGMRPTPELSFAIREYGCSAGINITASHNPKEYNGYKVYWSDGAQLPPKHASAVADKMAELDIFESPKTMSYGEAIKAGLIKTLGRETDEKFLARVMEMVHPDNIKDACGTFKMVYTPFHGTGRDLIPEALSRLGLKNVYCEEKQMVPDGDFSTVVSPNPENPEGFYLAEAYADKVGADFIIGSDPDADRVGMIVRGKDGKFRPITGNQAGIIMFDYLINYYNETGTMPPNPVALKTIVSTEMVRKIAQENGIDCFDTFTGFKFIAEKKDALENSGKGKVMFSFEESYGYMLGDFVRDKDAVTATTLFSEIAAWYSLKGMTMLDALDALYEKYGFYREKTLNLVMPGLDGAEKMQKLMTSLRENAPADVSGEPVAITRDYLSGEETDVKSGETKKMELSDSNVLSFILEDGTTILIRPSGTEPKIKVYVMAHGATPEEGDRKIEKFSAWALALQE